MVNNTDAGGSSPGKVDESKILNKNSNFNQITPNTKNDVTAISKFYASLGLGFMFMEVWDWRVRVTCVWSLGLEESI